MREKRKNNSIKVLLRLLPGTVKPAPVLFLAFAVITVCHGVSWGVETVMQQRFFDQAAAMAEGRASLGAAFAALGFLGIANVGCQVLNGAGNFLPDVLGNKVLGYQSKEIHEKIARLSPVVFEDTGKLDDINKAEAGKENAFWFVCDFTALLTFYIPYFLFMGWYLFSLKPVLAVVIVIIFLPTALAQLIRMKAFSGLEDESAPVRREYEHYEACMVSREFFRETRLLGGFSYFKRLYLEALDLMQRLKYRASMKSNLFELSMRILTVAGYVGILLLLFDALMKREVSVGAFAAVFNSLGMLYNTMEEIICRHISNMAQNMGSIRNYLNFLDLDEREWGPDNDPGWGDIALSDVTFAYPGAEADAIRNVSVTLKKGETLAVVGENGSGKSTLVRLIAGLYEPKSGSITRNGTDTGALSMRALTARTSAVFQKFQRYQMTLGENITISDRLRRCGEDALDRVCGMAGLDKEDEVFQSGYETMLSREFDGVDLSGGQWQRTAIARGFFRDHDLIILDEPTAAIDPYEETRIYNRFAEIARNKSALIVTHRLGCVKLADRILVMSKGRAVQIGTHEELIAREGEYKRLYEAQEQWYQEG